MQPLAAGGLEKRCEADVLQELLDDQRCLLDLLPGDVIRGIEIENDAIGSAEVLSTRSPWVHLEDAHLNQRDQSACRVRHHVICGTFAAADFDPSDRLVDA